MFCRRRSGTLFACMGALMKEVVQEGGRNAVSIQALSCAW